MNEPVIIQKVALPLPHDLQDFLTPDWTRLVEFYPEFCRRVFEAGEEPWDPQPWMLTICKELERRKAREGRTADAWMKRVFEHFGLGWFMGAMEGMMAAKQEVVGDDGEGGGK